ncbi:hypothetical protein B0A55_02062 [Friedmanniomyces simplex]|uniref:Uncharacterized protein n=1 Tax=Friedmanniomyces simplex TaxID=329884 RepID=A0A4U0XXJ4_9PEZI|nr:hypothetical protein B0A55_02062 [Friedmanniomyces simplex]
MPPPDVPFRLLLEAAVLVFLFHALIWHAIRAFPIYLVIRWSNLPQSLGRHGRRTDIFFNWSDFKRWLIMRLVEAALYGACVVVWLQEAMLVLGMFEAGSRGAGEAECQRMVDEIEEMVARRP